MMMIVRAFRATLDPRPDASGAGRELCIQPETRRRPERSTPEAVQGGAPAGQGRGAPSS